MTLGRVESLAMHPRMTDKFPSIQPFPTTRHEHDHQADDTKAANVTPAA